MAVIDIISNFLLHLYHLIMTFIQVIYYVNIYLHQISHPTFAIAKFDIFYSIGLM